MLDIGPVKPIYPRVIMHWQFLVTNWSKISCRVNIVTCTVYIIAVARVWSVTFSFLVCCKEYIFCSGQWIVVMLSMLMWQWLVIIVSLYWICHRTVSVVTVMSCHTGHIGLLKFESLCHCSVFTVQHDDVITTDISYFQVFVTGWPRMSVLMFCCSLYDVCLCVCVCVCSLMEVDW